MTSKEKPKLPLRIILLAALLVVSCTLLGASFGVLYFNNQAKHASAGDAAPSKTASPQPTTTPNQAQQTAATPTPELVPVTAKQEAFQVIRAENGYFIRLDLNGATKEFTFGLSGDDVKRLLGKPDTEQILDGPDAVLGYLYGNLTITFNPISNRADGFYYRTDAGIFDTAWYKNLGKPTFGTRQDSVHGYYSDATLQTLKFDTYSEGVVVYLLQTNRSEAGSNPPRQTPSPSPAPQKQAESADGVMKIKRGDAVLVKNVTIQNPNSIPMVVFDHSTIRETLDGYTKYGPNGPETVMLDKPVLSNPLTRSGNVSVFVDPSYAGGLILNAGESGDFKIVVKAAPKAKLGYYEATVFFSYSTNPDNTKNKQIFQSFPIKFTIVE